MVMGNRDESSQLVLESNERCWDSSRIGTPKASVTQPLQIYEISVQELSEDSALDYSRA
ncbi:hypothetical protein DPMN_042382 [Dreissena polymorpha]|uniref:Uncharacterized protein n=1 Tax=Dreissena polymorpha TaxID=45954 RepID=A0A9D4D0B2_DREPO|nr:hypothetical protein DPMN_042382 [Dreissena polymorpha]